MNFECKLNRLGRLLFTFYNRGCILNAYGLHLKLNWDLSDMLLVRKTTESSAGFVEVDVRNTDLLQNQQIFTN